MGLISSTPGTAATRGLSRKRSIGETASDVVQAVGHLLAVLAGASIRVHDVGPKFVQVYKAIKGSSG